MGGDMAEPGAVKKVHTDPDFCEVAMRRLGRSILPRSSAYAGVGRVLIIHAPDTPLDPVLSPARRLPSRGVAMVQTSFFASRCRA